jgi:hypothetical protein
MEHQKTSPQEYRYADMPKRRKTFLMNILGFVTWNVETLHHKKYRNTEMRNGEMAKCKTLKYRGSGLGVSKHFITEVSKHRNEKCKNIFLA